MNNIGNIKLEMRVGVGTLKAEYFHSGVMGQIAPLEARGATLTPAYHRRVELGCDC